MEQTGRERRTLRLRASNGANTITEVKQTQYVCAVCAQTVWVDAGAEVAHVCDPAAVARVQALDATIASLTRVREGLEEARSLASQCAQMARTSAC